MTTLESKQSVALFCLQMRAKRKCYDKEIRQASKQARGQTVSQHTTVNRRWGSNLFFGDAISLPLSCSHQKEKSVGTQADSGQPRLVASSSFRHSRNVSKEHFCHYNLRAICSKRSSSSSTVDFALSENSSKEGKGRDNWKITHDWGEREITRAKNNQSERASLD